MNRWSRIVLALSWAAALAWIGGGWLGFEVRDEASLVRHTLLGFAALLALVLTQAWIGIYLLVLGRFLRKIPRFSDDAASRMMDRRAIVASLVTMTAVLSQFAVSNALYPAHLDPIGHAIGGLVTSVLVLAGLEAQRRALRRAGETVRALAS